MFDIERKIQQLTKQLYPKGRAFGFVDGVLDELHEGLGKSETQLLEDVFGIQDTLLPDNPRFTVEDAERWERRLGLISSSGATLEQRKLAIKRKMNHPGEIRERQSAGYLQKSLQDAGFDVYVYENRFSDGMGGFETRTPADVFGVAATTIWEHSTTAEHGVIEHGTTSSGSVWGDCIAKYLEREKDAFWDVGSHLKSTFFISGDPIGTKADIPIYRLNEFRQMVLRLKPMHSVAFLNANYQGGYYESGYIEIGYFGAN